MNIILGITKSNFGGAQRYVFDLARTFKDQGHQVSVICGGNGLLVQKLSEINIPCHVLDTLGRDVRFGSDIDAFFTIYRLLKQEKPDVFHVNSSKMAGLGALAGRLAGTKRIVFTGHAWAFNEQRSWISRVIIAALHVLTVWLSHITIAVSDKARQDIIRIPFVPKKKVIRIYNGIEAPTWIPREDARTELLQKLSGDRNVVPTTIRERLWMGTFSELHPNKGLDICITAIASLPSEQLNKLAFFICGDGEQYPLLKKMIVDHNLTHHIFMLGYVKNASLYSKAFDIFSLTSRTEAFPYAVIEASMAGLPTIASRVGGIPEILGRDYPFLTEPNNPASIARCIERCIKSPRDDKLIEHIRHTTERFTLETCVRQTLNAYGIQPPSSNS